MTRYIFLMLMMILASDAAAREAVWIEGENPTRHDFRRHGWYDGVNKGLLSAGQWLSHYDQAAKGEATYRFTLKQGGRYTWWLRCNVVLMTQSYRLDGGAAVEMDLTSDVRGRPHLSACGSLRSTTCPWPTPGKSSSRPSRCSTSTALPPTGNLIAPQRAARQDAFFLASCT